MYQRWNWLRDRLKQTGSNPARFAKDLDWPASRVYELFSGRTKAIPLDRVAKAASLVGVRLDSMLNFNSGLSDEISFSGKNEISVLSSPECTVPELDLQSIAAAGTLSSLGESNEWEDNDGDFLRETTFRYNDEVLPSKRIKDNWQIPEDYLNEINVQSKNVYIVEALGDSMYPTVGSGDKVIVDASAKGRQPSPDGVFAIWDGLGIAIKRIELIPNSIPTTLRIISDNPKHGSYERSADNCKIRGRAVGVIKRI